MDLATILISSLSPDTAQRSAAEKELERLQPDAQFALALTDLIANLDNPLHTRQITGIILRKYVNERWSPFFVAFKGSPPPPEIKDVIRQRLYALLATPHKQIRTACAYALASIASCDYPEQYPSLLHDLAQLIQQGGRDGVHGAMRVLLDFVKADLTEAQLVPITQELLPLLLQILKNPHYADSTRGLTVAVLRQCVLTLEMVKSTYPDAVKDTANKVIPVWMDAFIEVLQVPPQLESRSQWGIRFEIVKTISSVFSTFKPLITASNRIDILTRTLIDHLGSLLPIFNDIEVYDTNTYEQPDGEEDDDGATVNELICPIVDLLTGFANNKHAKSTIEQVIPVLVRLSLEWGQMTVEDEETWGSDPNAFVDDEEDETENYSLRVATHDLLGTLLDRYPSLTAQALGPVTGEMLANSQSASQEGNQYWWKPIEAALAAIGNLSNQLGDEDHPAAENFDLVGLCQSVVSQFVSAKEAPYLQGRAFVFASKFATNLPEALVDAFVEAAASILTESDAGVPVKLSAVRAIRNFAHDLDSDRIGPKALPILSSVVPLLSLTTESTLGLLVEAVDGLLSTIEKETLTTDLVVQLSSVILPVWEKNINDPLLSSQLDDLFVTLSKLSPSVHTALVNVSVSPLVSAVSRALPGQTSDDDIDARLLASSALQLINSIVGARAQGLEPGVLDSTCPALFSILEASDDRSLVQDGIELLTTFIRKDIQGLLEWNNDTLVRILNVIAKLLSTAESEGSALFIGDVITQLFRNVPKEILDPALPQLLKVVLDRLALSKTSAFTQNLVIPFAYLIHTRRKIMLDYLANTAVLDATTNQMVNGLEILLRMWSENAETFRGFWAIRISTLALVDLYTSQDPRLESIFVKGDQIFDEANKNTIMTRSKTRNQPISFTSINFPLKAVKLILNELQNAGTSAAKSNVLKDVDEDDEDDDWEDDDPLGGADDDIHFLSDLLNPGGAGLLDAFDEDDNEEDLKNDPDAQLDIAAYLSDFLRRAYTDNTFNTHERCADLTPQEQAIFQHAMVN
ncbi:ARM repeat-containing protein [Wallemia mellicola]|uniref:ARM repeat-containing protein n=1 Tax=Wallemia mellicola TaxID=1708541 RepID=A0AB74KER1_9BASI|nr:ARM repeat-containing protein [Wallemia mellicola]